MLDKDLVPLRRKINADNRSRRLEFLTKHGYTVVPGSQANFFMVDTKRPGGEFQSAMLGENVLIGRHLGRDADVCARERGQQERDGEVPGRVRQMHGPAAGRNGAARIYVPALNPSELHRGGMAFA